MVYFGSKNQLLAHGRNRRNPNTSMRRGKGPLTTHSGRCKS
jgi:hypothetical protein